MVMSASAQIMDFIRDGIRSSFAEVQAITFRPAFLSLPAICKVRFRLDHFFWSY